MSAGMAGKKANHSPLMKRKARLLSGHVANVCPFGCENQHLDDNGYCFHLVGFTNDKKTLEPLVTIKGRRVNDSRKKELVRKTDKLMRITTSYRVYRDVKPSKEEAERLALIEAPEKTQAEVTDLELEELASKKTEDN